MKLTHEKMVHLSHMVVDALEGVEGLNFSVPLNELRNKILGVIREEVRQDAEIEARVYRKISSQKRNIPEGSPEWDILHRKYYEEELTARRS